MAQFVCLDDMASSQAMTLLDYSVHLMRMVILLNVLSSFSNGREWDLLLAQRPIIVKVHIEARASSYAHIGRPTYHTGHVCSLKYPEISSQVFQGERILWRQILVLFHCEHSVIEFHENFRESMLIKRNYEKVR